MLQLFVFALALDNLALSTKSSNAAGHGAASTAAASRA